MAENPGGQEKTEPATPRKRQQAREQGNVPRSQDLNTTLMLVAGVAAFYLFAGYFYGNIAGNIRYFLDNSAQYDITPDSAPGLMIDIGLRVLWIVFPFFAIFYLVAILSNLVQVGFLLTAEPLKPNPQKINPAEGIKRLFSMRTNVELLKSIGKMFVITPVMIYTIYEIIGALPSLMNYEMLDILVHIGYGALDVAIRALIILILLSVADYAYQRWQHEQDLKMSKEEVKQEMKDIQGDPQIKSRIRSIQQEMARKRMMREVPEADVVVTNPTEYAVALRYRSGEMAAPRVVAKGRGAIARRIKEIAAEHGRPVVENRLLAQTLYKLTEVGDAIPPELYQAVAEVLAYVYRLNNRDYQTA